MIVLLGNGILGFEIKKMLEHLYGSSHKQLVRKDLDLEKDSLWNIYEKLGKFFTNKDRHNILINAAAYTKVDLAEKERNLAFLINASGPGKLATFCKDRCVKLIHISTDFVFDGKKAYPYIEHDNPNPINYYGYSKLMGERLIQNSGCDHAILRTAWLYNDTCGIIPKFISLIKEGKKLNGISDQISVPTHAKDLTRQIEKIIDYGVCGTFHTTPKGMTNPCSLFKYLSSKLGADVKRIFDTQTYTFFSERASRPRMCVLENFNLKSLGIDIMPNWIESVDRVLSETQQ